MGIVAFQWGDNQLTLLQNRDSLDSWKTKPAGWDEANKILRSIPGDNFGTWCGISKRGRVAFIVDARLPELLSPSMFPPVVFLRGELSPRDFAEEWSSDNIYGCMMNSDLEYYMIVADMNSKSMVYISKTSRFLTHVHKEEVDFGVHTLSASGVDSQSPEDLHVKSVFCEMIGDYENKQVTPLMEMADKFIHDPVQESDQTSASSSSSSSSLDVNKRISRLHMLFRNEAEEKDSENETMSITLLAMKPTEEAKEKRSDSETTSLTMSIRAFDVKFPKEVVKQNRSETMSTIALAVKPIKEVKLYERYFENWLWKNFTFHIVH